jgi:cell division protein FtsL
MGDVIVIVLIVLAIAWLVGEYIVHIQSPQYQFRKLNKKMSKTITKLNKKLNTIDHKIEDLKGKE